MYRVRFQFFAPVTVTNAVLWGVALYSFCKNRRFGGTSYLHNQWGKIGVDSRSLNLSTSQTKIFFNPDSKLPLLTNLKKNNIFHTCLICSVWKWKMDISISNQTGIFLEGLRKFIKNIQGSWYLCLGSVIEPSERSLELHHYSALLVSHSRTVSSL
jgi:hypothetical protein